MFLKAKCWGKSQDFNTKGFFTETIEFSRNHFQTKTSTALQWKTAEAEVTEANFKTSACLITFYRQCK